MSGKTIVPILREKVIPFIQKQWFLIGICASVVLGYAYPQWGNLLRQYDVINIGIFLSFFCTGLCLETQSSGSVLVGPRSDIGLASGLKTAAH